MPAAQPARRASSPSSASAICLAPDVRFSIWDEDADSVTAARYGRDISSRWECDSRSGGTEERQGCSCHASAASRRVCARDPCSVSRGGPPRVWERSQPGLVTSASAVPMGACGPGRRTASGGASSGGTAGRRAQPCAEGTDPDVINRSTLAASALFAAVALSLSACSQSAPAETAPTATATTSQQDTASPAPTGAEPAPAPAVAGDPLPEVPPATGTTATNGVITVTIPDGFSAGAPADGTQLFDGPSIPESVSPDGTTSQNSLVALEPAQAYAWDGTFSPSEREGAVQSAYVFAVPGADMAGVDFVSAEQGRELAMDPSIGGTVWDGPSGTATICVQVGDQFSRIIVNTSPGEQGLQVVAAIARSITVG